MSRVSKRFKTTSSSNRSESVFTQGAAESPIPIGIWLHENTRIQLEITPCGDRLCGKLVWFKWPNDTEGCRSSILKNPDPALRARPLFGLTVLSALRPADDGTLEDGIIYNPDDGETYHALMSLREDGTLRVRAYVVFPLFGKTQIWTRPLSGLNADLARSLTKENSLG